VLVLLMRTCDPTHRNKGVSVMLGPNSGIWTGRGKSENGTHNHKTTGIPLSDTFYTQDRTNAELRLCPRLEKVRVLVEAT